MKKLGLLILISLLIMGFVGGGAIESRKATLTPRPSKITLTPTPTRTRTVTSTATVTRTPTVAITFTPTPTRPTETSTVTFTPTLTRTLTSTPTVGGVINPYLGAPACAHTDNSAFHTLWNSALGCHYDHEHGEDPFTQEVANAFPDFDLYALLGNVEVGHTNPSSPMENTHKHGGFKWQVDLTPPNGSVLGFERAVTAVCAYAVQWHSFGDYSIEFETRIHSSAALFEMCRPGEEDDPGYAYIVQHIDYGEREMGYQGVLLREYPDNPSPAYDPAFAPYWSVDCFGPDVSDPVYPRSTDCRLTRTENRNSTTTWTSNPKNLVGSGSTLLMLLFRARDTYQLLDSTDLTYPYSWRWICSSDNGISYNPSACRYNNTTVTLHQLQGTIPSAWDNLAGFDTEPEVGRITAEGYVTRFGTLNSSCTGPSSSCFPIKLYRAYVGVYGSFLIPDKAPAFSNASLPERDIYFCGNVVCLESSTNSVPSGWIGPGN